jgi:hypothetical protein
MSATVVDFSILAEINERLKRIEQHHARQAGLEQEAPMTATEAARHILGLGATDDDVDRKADALKKRAYRRSIPSIRDGREYLFKRKDIEPLRRLGGGR